MNCNCRHRTPILLFQFKVTMCWTLGSQELATILHPPQGFNRKLGFTVWSVGDNMEHKQTPAHKDPYWTASGPWNIHYLWSKVWIINRSPLFRVKNILNSQQRSPRRLQSCDSLLWAASFLEAGGTSHTWGCMPLTVILHHPACLLTIFISTVSLEEANHLDYVVKVRGSH